MKITQSEKEQIKKQRAADKKQLSDAKRNFVKDGLDLSNQKMLLAYLLANTEVSHRRLQGIMGQESSGFVANVLSGKKRITNSHAVRLAEACGMTNPEKVKFYEGVLNKV